MATSLPHDRLDARHLAHLAIFPLPNTVFFPHTLLPLHIFEPRYRALARDALDAELPIAVVLMRSEQTSGSTAGAEPFHEVAGVGRLAEHMRLPDGRFNILLEGLGRVKILRELTPSTPYRQVQAEWLAETPLDPDQAADGLATLRNCITALSRLRPELGNPLMGPATQVSDALALVDILSSVLFPSLEVRQSLLAEAVSQRRYERVLDRLAELLTQVGGSVGGDN